MAATSRSRLGLDFRRPYFDLGTGTALALVIGVPGVGLYLLARELGVNTTVAAANLPDVWWAMPVLVLAAVGTVSSRRSLSSAI